jgi:hypothetical protein
MRTILVILAAMSATAPAVAADAVAPAGVAGQLPSGYGVIATARVTAGNPVRSFEIVALARKDEGQSRGAPARPLLVFEQRDGRFTPAGRNDHVVMKADEGGQCDPFLDGGATIAVKGRYFTIENGVACGQHWTDYITFRLDNRVGGFVFDNERQEAWELNPNADPNADALVRAGPPRTIRDRPGQVTPFADWRPKG